MKASRFVGWLRPQGASNMKLGSARSDGHLHSVSSLVICSNLKFGISRLDGFCISIGISISLSWVSGIVSIAFYFAQLDDRFGLDVL